MRMGQRIIFPDATTFYIFTHGELKGNVHFSEGNLAGVPISVQMCFIKYTLCRTPKQI